MEISFTFEVWWACRKRPFWTAKQTVVISAPTEWQALARAVGREPTGPFLHAGAGCCYVADVRKREASEHFGGQVPAGFTENSET